MAALWAAVMRAIVAAVALVVGFGLGVSVAQAAPLRAEPIHIYIPPIGAPQHASIGLAAGNAAADRLLYEWLSAYHEWAFTRRAAWEALHRCEQGDNWYADGRGGNGLWFQGGLGIARDLYVSIAGHSALLDTPEQQIAVAEVVLARYGRSAWACPLNV